MSQRAVDQAFHLSRSISEDVLFLTAQLTLLFAKFALLLAQRSLLLSELSLSLARLGLQVAKFALQVADFFLNASKILFRTGLSKSFQLRFQFVQVFGHIRDFNANSLLLFSQGFLLFAEFVLFLFDRVELTEKIRRAFNSCLIANHVGLAVMPEPYEIAGNLFLQEFNEFGRLVHAGAFAIAGNADVHFTGRNHKLLTITVRAPNEYRGI